MGRRFIGLGVVASVLVLAVTGPALAGDVGAIVQGRIRTLEVGHPQTYKGLTVVPLKAADRGDLRYLTLDQAVKQKAIRLLEKGEGEVNMVKAQNLSSSAIFIMDGEEIVGAKQNRILNTSVMLPPKQVVELPVSCVEHGRWVATSSSFGSKGTQLFAKARQKNQVAVAKNRAARPAAAAMSDQEMIWESVADKRATLRVSGKSEAMHDAYVKYGDTVNDYVKHFEVVSGQIGAVFAINGKIIGADIFDQHETLDRLFAKLVKSYALDAIENQRSAAAVVNTADVRRFIELALKKDIRIRDYDSAGQGRDVRLTSSRISGAGLVVSSIPVHIALFAAEPIRVMPSQSDRLRSPVQRRDQMNTNGRR